jgi:hypothetical protein
MVYAKPRYSVTFVRLDSMPDSNDLAFADEIAEICNRARESEGYKLVSAVPKQDARGQFEGMYLFFERDV